MLMNKSQWQPMRKKVGLNIKVAGVIIRIQTSLKEDAKRWQNDSYNNEYEFLIVQII